MVGIAAGCRRRDGRRRGGRRRLGELIGLSRLTGLSRLSRPRSPTGLRELTGLTAAEPERRGLHGGTESLSSPEAVRPAAAPISRTIQVLDETLDALEAAADLPELSPYRFHLRAWSDGDGDGGGETGSARSGRLAAGESLRRFSRRRPRLRIARRLPIPGLAGDRRRGPGSSLDHLSPLLVEVPDLPLELLHLLLQVLHAIVSRSARSALHHAPDDLVPVLRHSPAARRLELSLLEIEEEVEIEFEVVVDDEIDLTDRVEGRLLGLASCLATSLLRLTGRLTSSLLGFAGRFASNLLRLLYRLASGFLRLACRLQRFGATLLVAQEWGGKEAGQNEKDSACGSHSMLSVLLERP